MPRTERELWVCPDCGRAFANANQSHTCAPLGDLDSHFVGVDPGVRRSFDIIVDALGPLMSWRRRRG